MGDRTTVTLTVLKEHKDQVIEILRREEGLPSETEEDEDGLVVLTYEEVNYGEIDDLVIVRSRHIPFSFEWAAGGDFTRGERHLRFLEDGTSMLTEFGMQWPADVIFHCIKEIENADDPKAVLKRILDENQEPSWDNQLENSKMAQAVALISQ